MEQEIDQRFIFQEKMINEEKSFQKAYETIFRTFKNRICIEYKTNEKLVQLTFSQYDEFIRKISYKLDNYLGTISKGEWVALKYDNHPNWLAVFWALLMAGYKVLLIDCKHNSELTSYIMGQAGANVIICAEDNEISPLFLHVSFEEITTVDEISKFGNEAWENEIAFCTSGTTGTSKVFVYNGKAFINQLSISKHLCKNFDIMIDKNGDKILTMLPLHHIFGFVLVNLILSFGGRAIYPKNKSPKEVMEACKEHGVTWMPSVPIFWDSIIKSFTNKVNQLGIDEVSKLEKLIDTSLNLEKNYNYNDDSLDNTYIKEYFNNLFGPELKICISGGGHISKESLRILNASNYYFMNGYGLTETGIVSVCNTYSIEKRISGSIGTIFDNVEYGILQTDDFTKKKVIKKEGTGELLIASDFLHSARMEDGKIVSPEIYNNKWYCTGDIVKVEEDYLHIEGRIKDVIVNSSGENVYPDELEEYFNNLPHCSNICVIGMKDDEFNDSTTLILNISIELNDTDSISEIAFSFIDINEKLPNYKRVHKVLISKAPMPMANEIKVKRLKLREMIECNEYNYEVLDYNLSKLAYYESAVSDCESKDNTMISVNNIIDSELFNKIKNEAKFTISQTTGLSVDEIKDNHHLLDDLGMSSLNMMELFLKFEDDYNILIPDTEYHKFMTVNDFSHQVFFKINLQ